MVGMGRSRSLLLLPQAPVGWAEAGSWSGPILLQVTGKVQVLPSVSSSSSCSSTVGQRSLDRAALIWEARVHADKQCSRMQSDAMLANPASVEAEMWRVMQHKVICQLCRVWSSKCAG